MKAGKVLLGAAVGVGAIAAAPFTGGGSLFGGATLIASLAGAGGLATAAGVAGATVAGVADDLVTKKQKEEAEKKAYEKAKAEMELKIQNLYNSIETFRDKIYEYQKLQDYSMAVFAIGFSVANCDGEMTNDEIEGVNEFVAGKVFNQYPKNLQNAILDMKKNPPTFNETMQYIKKIPRDIWDVFDEVIELTMLLDGVIKEEEKAYLTAWKKFKSENQSCEV